jgi:hypothetical protein
VHLDREGRRDEQESREGNRDDKRETVKHESSFREGFGLPAAEVF